MAQGNFNNVLEWAALNNFKGFEVYTGSEKGGALLYKSNADISSEDNTNALREIMARTNGLYFTYIGWQTETKNRLTFRYEFSNEIAKPNHVAMQQATVSGVPEDLVQQKIEAAVGAIRLEFEKNDLQRREKELNEQQQEFRSQKESLIGIAISQLGKILPQITTLQVAGVSPTVHSEKQHVIAPVDTESKEHSEEQDEMTARIESALEKWAKADPEFLSLLEKIADMAEKGDSNYLMAKKFL